LECEIKRLKKSTIHFIRKEPGAPVDSEKKIPEPKLLYYMKKLQGWFNHEASRIVESSMS
jgi:hypothetical protein